MWELSSKMYWFIDCIIIGGNWCQTIYAYIYYRSGQSHGNIIYSIIRNHTIFDRFIFYTKGAVFLSLRNQLFVVMKMNNCSFLIKISTLSIVFNLSLLSLI